MKDQADTLSLTGITAINVSVVKERHGIKRRITSDVQLQLLSGQTVEWLACEWVFPAVAVGQTELHSLTGGFSKAIEKHVAELADTISSTTGQPVKIIKKIGVSDYSETTGKTIESR